MAVLTSKTNSSLPKWVDDETVLNAENLNSMVEAIKGGIPATHEEFGVVKLGDTLYTDDTEQGVGPLNVRTATSAETGIVKPGYGLSIDDEGTISLSSESNIVVLEYSYYAGRTEFEDRKADWEFIYDLIMTDKKNVIIHYDSTEDNDTDRPKGTFQCYMPLVNTRWSTTLGGKDDDYDDGTSEGVSCFSFAVPYYTHTYSQDEYPFNQPVIYRITFAKHEVADPSHSRGIPGWKCRVETTSSIKVISSTAGTSGFNEIERALNSTPIVIPVLYTDNSLYTYIGNRIVSGVTRYYFSAPNLIPGDNPDLIANKRKIYWCTPTGWSYKQGGVEFQIKNLVTTISSSSLNTQYPSALAVYNALDARKPIEINITYDEDTEQYVCDTDYHAALTAFHSGNYKILVIDESDLRHKDYELSFTSYNTGDFMQFDLYASAADGTFTAHWYRTEMGNFFEAGISREYNRFFVHERTTESVEVKKDASTGQLYVPAYQEPQYELINEIEVTDPTINNYKITKDLVDNDIELEEVYIEVEVPIQTAISGSDALFVRVYDGPEVTANAMLYSGTVPKTSERYIYYDNWGFKKEKNLGYGWWGGAFVSGALNGGDMYIHMNSAIINPPTIKLVYLNRVSGFPEGIIIRVYGVRA